MNRIAIFVVWMLSLAMPAKAKVSLIDSNDKSPIAAASVFNSSGNMIGLTWSDGTLKDIPESAYPVTIRCIGYQPITIPSAEDKVWAMTPKAYELDEIVITPVKRNILKQTFYVREYFSMSTSKDTVTLFAEHMADRFITESTDSKFTDESSLRILKTNSYINFQIGEKDDISTGEMKTLPSMLSMFEFNNNPITAPKSFLSAGNAPRIHQKEGKSGPTQTLRQNGNTFTYIEDVLAITKNHTWSPWPLKLLGFTLKAEQLYNTQAYRTNDKGVYLPHDLTEASFVMEAEGRGKYIRRIFETDETVTIHTMIELYTVDNDYFSKEEAKKEKKSKPQNIQISAPASVPPLNKATQRIVERAKKQ